MITLSDIFDKYFKDLKVDNRFIDAIKKYETWLMHKDREHLAFFGSNLVGVHSVRFRVIDIVKFFNDVCDVEYEAIRTDLKTVTTIVQDFKVSSDAMNLVIFYLIHRVLSEARLDKSKREKGAFSLAMIFFMRSLIIKQSEYWHIPADPKIAQAAYGELSRKNLIKQLGSWKSLLEYRCKELLDKKSIHYKRLVDFKDDAETTYMVADCENRIRAIYVNYNIVFYRVYESGLKINVSSNTHIDLEGELKLKEKIDSAEQYLSLLRQVIMDRDSFVRHEIINILLDINTNTSPRILTHTLTWLSDSYNDPKYSKEIDEWCKLILTHSFYLLSNASLYETKNYTTMLVTLKNLYLSTRSTDKDLFEIRKIGDKFIKLANGRLSTSLAMATRTACILYITLIAMVSEKSI